MAYAVSKQTVGFSGDFLTKAVASLKTALARRAIYNRTVAELKGLSDRDLQDLGVSRSQIHGIAHEAAFGR